MPDTHATHGSRPPSTPDLPGFDGGTDGPVTFSPIRAQRAADWEHAKGHLRALTAANMAVRGPVESRVMQRALKLDAKVSAFIASIEAEELYLCLSYDEQTHIAEGSV